MLIHRKVGNALVVFLLTLVMSLMAPITAQAEQASLVERIPFAESNLFILDVSGSTNSVELWKNLRSSVVSKLTQPFGHPDSNSISTKLPTYVSITSISKNSQNSPIFSLVTKSDVQKMWGAVEQVFPKSTDLRLKKITDELFGESGAWASQAKVFSRSKVIVPTLSACKSSAIGSINKRQFLKNTDTNSKNVLAEAICEGVISISKGLKQADEYFSKPVCDAKAVCSDIAGAIYRSTSLAADLAGQGKDKIKGKEVKNKLCIAIASDMLNESPGVAASSPLNSGRVARVSQTPEKAKASGVAAAKTVGVKFTSDVDVRVVMVGIGTGANPLPLDRNSYLLAYWEGFFSASGVKQTNQGQSLNQACS